MSKVREKLILKMNELVNEWKPDRTELDAALRLFTERKEGNRKQAEFQPM